jgi:hypothetical protein
MPVSRLQHIPGIGVDKVGDAADAAADPRFLRMENLDTDLPPPAVAREVTRAEGRRPAEEWRSADGRSADGWRRAAVIVRA